jgi:hypothetical protein
MSNTEKEIQTLNQFIQNRIIDIDDDIERLEEQIKKLKCQRKKECDKFEKVTKMLLLLEEIRN